MASWAYRSASLVARGGLLSLWCEFWTNGPLPADPAKLARVLGVNETEITLVLAECAAFLEIIDGHIEVPELRAYKNHLEARRIAQSEGGKHAAEITNSKKKTKRAKRMQHESSDSTSRPTSTSPSPPRVTVESLSKAKHSKAKSNPRVGAGEVADPFVDAIKQAEADEYARRSGR
jgi:hypothetical protein